MPRLPAWRVPGIGRLCTPFGRRTTVGNPGFGFQPYHSPPSLVRPPCGGVDDSSRLPRRLRRRTRVRARPRSLLASPRLPPGLDVLVPFFAGLGLVGLGLVLVLGLGLRPRPRPLLMVSALASPSASTCFLRARHWLPPSWWLPRAAGGLRPSRRPFGAPCRHFFGSDASQAAELSLLGFPGGAGMVR